VSARERVMAAKVLRDNGLRHFVVKSVSRDRGILVAGLVLSTHLKDGPRCALAFVEGGELRELAVGKTPLAAPSAG
jgi:hypothetical protein